MNSRAKGKRGELEAAAFLRLLGFTGARRGQQFRGGADSPDVQAIPGVHIEVKCVQALNLTAAMAQAVEDATIERGGNVPLVMHKRNRGDWMMTLRAADLARFVEAVGKEWIRVDQQDEQGSLTIATVSSKART